jgi:hypothetical protein
LHSDNDTTTCALLAIQTSVPRLRQGFRVLDLLLNYNDYPTMPFFGSGSWCDYAALALTTRLFSLPFLISWCVLRSDGYLDC